MNDRELVIVGDEAWIREEWEAEQRKREAYREHKREYYRRPEVKARIRAYRKEYDKQPERRAYAREWMWRHRHGGNERPAGWLHEVGCTGNHRGNSRCKPIPAYHGEDAA